MTNNIVNSKTRTKNGKRLLELCKQLQRWTEINSLVNENSDINLTNAAGRSALHYAAEKGSLDLITKLIALGADVHCRESERGYTPLYFAVLKGKVSAIKLLLEAGADINAKANHDVTPLHLAARWGPTNVVKYLIKEGSDVNARENFFNFNPLLTAAYCNKDEIMEILIKKGSCDVNCSNNDGLTPLHIASMSGSFKSVRRLIENGADVNAKMNLSQITSLHLASMSGFFQNVPGLKKFCVKTDNNHILDELVPWKHSQILEDENYESVVKVLIENHSDLQAKDSEGSTALHFAARYQSKVLKTLLKCDADVIAQDNHGHLPFHEALEHGIGLDWLLRYGTDINVIDETHEERIKIIMRRCRFKDLICDHLNKLILAELPIADVYKPYVEENCVKSILNGYLKDIKKMKSDDIGEDMMLYDFLHSTIDPKATLKFPNNVESQYPQYHGIIRACFHAPLKRRQLLDSARLAWYHITNINLPAICLEIIFDHLGTADLKIMVRDARKMSALKN